MYHWRVTMKKISLIICTIFSLIYSVSSQAYYVGDRALGGTVFITNQDGTHGLIVANISQGNVRYVDAQDACSKRSKHDLDGQNYFDWKVPTKSQFRALYDAKSQIAPLISIENNKHWIYRGAPDDTYKFSSDVMLVDFKNFKTYTANVNVKKYNLRCVRAF